MIAAVQVARNLYARSGYALLSSAIGSRSSLSSQHIVMSVACPSDLFISTIECALSEPRFEVPTRHVGREGGSVNYAH